MPFMIRDLPVRTGWRSLPHSTTPTQRLNRLSSDKTVQQPEAPDRPIEGFPCHPMSADAPLSLRSAKCSRQVPDDALCLAHHLNHGHSPKLRFECIRPGIGWRFQDGSLPAGFRSMSLLVSLVDSSNTSHRPYQSPGNHLPDWNCKQPLKIAASCLWHILGGIRAFVIEKTWQRRRCRSVGGGCCHSRPVWSF